MNNKNIHLLSRDVIIDQDHILLAYDPRPHPNHYYELNTLFYYLPGGHIDFKINIPDLKFEDEVSQKEEHVGFK